MSRMKLTCLLMGCMWLGVSAHAANLVQFTAGTPAKAAEVNANFKALNDELAQLKTFNNLTEEQVGALRTAIGEHALRWTNQAVDCTDNPRALMDLYAEQGAGLIYMAVTIKGDCYANLFQQYHGLTLSIRANPEEPARLLPDGSNWSVGGLFGGGLYLSNLTLLPPAEATGVLFSRVSQGAVDNVIIEGGGTGILAQAGAQAYLTNVQVKSTQFSALWVTSGANMRIFNNIAGIKLVDSAQGNGLRVEQAEVSIETPVNIVAPQAIQVFSNGSLSMRLNQQVPNRTTATGNIQISNDGQFHVQELALTGNLNLNQGTFTGNYLELTGQLNLNNGSSFYATSAKVVGQSNINRSGMTADISDITGKVRGGEGGQIVLRRGVLRAVNPTSMDYQQSMALELANGASASLGNYKDPNDGDDSAEFTLQGQTNVSISTLNTEWSELNGNVSSEGGRLRLNFSQINAPGRTESDVNTVNITSGSSLILHQSDLFARTLNLRGSHGSLNNIELGTTSFILNNGAVLDIYECNGTGNLQVDSSRINLHNCQLPNSFIAASIDSSVKMWGGQIGLVNLDSGSTASFTQMTLTGNGEMPWGDVNFVVGSASMMILDNVTLSKAKHFHNGNILRISNNSSMANSTLFCLPQATMEWWTQTAATFSSTGSCNLP